MTKIAFALLALLAVAQLVLSAKDKYGKDEEEGEYGYKNKKTTTTTAPTTTTTVTTPTTTKATTTTTTQSTTAKPTTTTCPPVTPNPKDVALVLDGSGSITAPLFNGKVLPFAKELAKKLSVSATGNDLAIVQYSNNAQLEFNFGTVKSVKEAEDRISKIRYISSGTFTGKALSFTANTVLPKARAKAEKLVIVVTDGDSSDAVVGPAKQLRDKGATVLAVGVGTGIKQKTLEEIAGGNKANTFAITNFDALNKLLEEKIKLC